MSTSLKHILRIGDTEANLSAGATRLKNKQAGISSDTKKIVYMDATGGFHVCQDMTYIRLSALSPANYPSGASGEARIFFGTDGQLHVQYPTGSPEVIPSTAPGSDGL
jgi:hypothetical protein